MRQKLVAGNWKMHGNLVDNQVLLSSLRAQLVGLRNVSCAVFPPAPYLAQVQQILAGSQIAWGAQNVSEHDKGAYTGEIAPAMLLDFGCSYVLLGHSERRAMYGETDTIVAAKFVAALAAGLTPVLCVGETLDEREANQAEVVISRQLDAVLAVAGVAGLAKSVVAYEPVWAIGTGKTASPEQAQAIHAFIRQKIAGLDALVAQDLTILYGGSVKASNAAELFSQADIDGGLIGGASLVADEFVAICKAAQS
ncbi:MAG: triose-phosphate isomerase [Sulfuriferula sp.]